MRAKTNLHWEHEKRKEPTGTGKVSLVERYVTELPEDYLNDGHPGTVLAVVRYHPKCRGLWCMHLGPQHFIPLAPEDASPEAAKVFAITEARERAAGKVA